MNETDEGLCGIGYDAPKEIKEYYKRLKELEKQDKTKVKVIRNGIIQLVDSTELVVGDIVELEAGNISMADMRLIETNNFA